MNKVKERRKEKRFHYELPVSFGEDLDVAVFHGVMVDISSSGMAFICDFNDNCPKVGQQLTTRFSIPRFGTNSSDMQDITRTGQVLRIDTIDESRCRVAISFDNPPFWNIPPRPNS